MPNIASILKSEIARISKREARKAVEKIHAQNVSLKKTISGLKDRIATLEKENIRLKTIERKVDTITPRNTEEIEKMRITAKGIRGLRKRLSLTQFEFGKLIGTSTQTVYNMENKEGVLKLRNATKKAIIDAREMGAREAKQKLADVTPREKTAKKSKKKTK